MLEVLGIKNADKLVPLEDDMKPKDPVMENKNVLSGDPVKAFQYQDHDSHIAVHMAMMQDPSVMQLIGQNPQAQMIQSAMMAHVADHVGFSYRQKIEQQLGMPLPPEDEKLPPQIELALSSMMAQAANQVLMKSQAQAAQQQAQQQAQDPVLQMQQQELQLKQQELELKKQKMITDAAADADELELKEEEMRAKLELEGMKVAISMENQKAQLDAKQAKMSADQERAGAQMGIDIAKSRAQMAQNRGNQNR